MSKQSSEALELADKIASFAPRDGKPIVLIARERRLIEDALRRCSAESELRKALQAAYLELKKHDADYHYRTPVAVNSMIVDALLTEPQSAAVNVEETPQEVADQAAYFDAHAERFAAAHAGMSSAQCQAESVHGVGVEMIDNMTPKQLSIWTDDSDCNVGKSALTRPERKP